MPKLSVKKSVTIEAPAEKIYTYLRDFKNWPDWSPWIIAEPDCPLTYADDGKSYSWDGKIIGSGEMEITGEDAPKSIDYQLTFLKPWKSVSKVRFQLTKKGGSTEVTWSMDGSLPFFLFFLKNMMTAFVGMDYERGLSMLKDKIETGSVPVKLEFVGLQDFPGLTYIGANTRCPISEIGPHMEKDMGKLHTFLASQNLKASGPPLSIYHKWNPVKGTADYTLGIPVNSKPVNLPAEFTGGEIPATSVYIVKHTGPYRCLGNAWSSGIMHSRGKVFRKNNAIHPFEIYESDPTEVAENDLVTVVHFPAKKSSP